MTISIAGETFDGQNLRRLQRGRSRIKRGSVKRSSHPPPPPASGTHTHGELYMKMNSNRLIFLPFFPPLRSTPDNTAVGLGRAAGHPYIFPSASGRPGNDVQERVGQVAVVIEGVVSASQGDVAEIPAERKRVKNTPSKLLLCGYVEESADYGSRFKSRLMPERLCQSNLTTNDQCSSRHLLACDTKWIRAFIFLSFFFYFCALYLCQGGYVTAEQNTLKI